MRNVGAVYRPVQSACVFGCQPVDVQAGGAGQLVDVPDRSAGSTSTAATVRATSLVAIGEVRPVPKGRANRFRSRSDGAANQVKTDCPETPSV